MHKFTQYVQSVKTAEFSNADMAHHTRIQTGVHHIHTHTHNGTIQHMQELLEGKTPDLSQEKHDAAVREEEACTFEVAVLEEQLGKLDWEKELELLQSEGARLEEEALAALEDAKLAHAADPSDETLAEVRTCTCVQMRVWRVWRA